VVQPEERPVSEGKEAWLTGKTKTAIRTSWESNGGGRERDDDIDVPNVFVFVLNLNQLNRIVARKYSFVLM